MKKTWIALAAVACASTSFAQSSVTLYGVADAAVGRVKTPFPVDNSGKLEFLSGSMMNNGTSRVGLRGVEDLGGGSRVGFNFEQGLDLDNGGTASTVWGRAANVWVGGNWGRVQLGRALTPSYNGMLVYELTGMANYSLLAGAYGAGASFDDFNSSQILYGSPKWGGFGFEVAYVSKNDTGANKWDMNLTYQGGPLSAGFSANKKSGNQANFGLGAKYDFGSFVVATSFQNARSVDRYPADAGAFEYRRRGVSLGGTAKFGAASLTLDVTRDLKHEVNNGDLKKRTNALLEAKYALSKRTFIYGAFLRFDGDNNYGVGVRHNF